MARSFKWLVALAALGWAQLAYAQGTPPVANAVSMALQVNAASIPVDLNITGGAPTSVAVSTSPSHGTATASGTTITYTPNSGYAGSDSFSYTATNGSGTSAPATVGLVVGGMPSMRFVTAGRVAPASAISFYGTATVHTNSLYNAAAGPNAFPAAPPEIVETARALKNNPDLIFEFVRNQIQTEFAYGERKGALGALIDKSGTAFDQNVLFVKLVSQAGFPARYRIGPVTVSGGDFANWTGVSDLGAACRLLSSGGIAAAFTPAAPVSCLTSGTITSVTMMHIWSQVQIGGTWYSYDPSFKAYAGPAPANLISASGLVAGAAASAAASGMDSGSSPATYIHNVGQASLNAYLNARGAQLLTWLKANAPALDIDQVTGITKIQPAYAPSGGWRYTTPPGLYGGAANQYTTGASVVVTACSGPQTTATYNCDIPDQYRTQLQVAMTVASYSALNWSFYVDDIDGRRVAIGTNFNDTGSVTGGTINPATTIDDSGVQYPNNYTFGQVSLLVDDAVVQNWSCRISFYTTPICLGAQSPGQVTLTAVHPYAANATTKATYADETVVKSLTATGAPVTIVSGWGMVSQERLAKWSNELAYDNSLPNRSTPPWKCGETGDYCFTPYAQSSGDLTRQKLAANWLAQMTRMMTLQTTIAGATVDHQHSIGVIDWQHTINAYIYPPPSGIHTGGPNYWGVTDEYTDLNIDTVASVTSKSDSAVQVAALSRSIALAAATLEGSVLEQMEDLPDTASTASRFAWGNNPGADNTSTDPEDPCWNNGGPYINNPRRFYDYTPTSAPTRSGLFLYEGSTSGCGASPLSYQPSYAPGFAGSAETAIGSYIASGFKVTASAETLLGPGARFGACTGTGRGIFCQPSHQRGQALVATQYDGTGNVLQVAHVLSNWFGISKGGGGKQPESFAQYDPAKAADALKDRFVDHSVALGVDLKSGTAGYSTPTLLSEGTGSVPYKLDYGLTFKAAPTGCNPYGPCTGPIQGGWNQNWDVRFSNSGSGSEAMGASSPFAAAGSLSAFLVMQDIFAQAGLSNLNQDVFATLAADWWRQQMLANTVTLNQGFSGQQYVRMVDGTWMRPVGSPGVLTQTGTRVRTRDLACHPHSGGYSASTSRRWDISGVTFSLQNAGGDVISFNNWGWQYDTIDENFCARAYGYQPTTWTWPQGVSLNFTYGTQSGGVTVDYTTGVTAITSSLGRTMSFTGSADVLTHAPFTATAQGVTVGHQTTALTSIADAVSSPSGGATGHFWNFAYTPIQARGASQRPVPYQQLYQVFDPINASLPALQYSYDTRGLVQTALDANGLQLPANAAFAPYSWFLALGGRGERDNPDGGSYTVYYDTDGDPVRNIEQLSITPATYREVDSVWDGRHRVTARTFPEGDQELFAYDANDNVTNLTKIPKPGSGLANIVVQATYEPTWNHLASIIDPMGNETDFTYYPSSALCGTTGATPSLMCLAQRPAVGGTRPTFSYQYNAIGLPTKSVDPTGVATTHAYDSFGNLTSTTEGAMAVGSNPALNLTTIFTPDVWGNVVQTVDPLTHTSNQTFDLDRRVVWSIAPDPGTGVRPATQTLYDANGRAIELDKGTTNAAGTVFNPSPVEATTTAYDPNGNKTQISVLDGPFGSAALSVAQMSYDGLNRVICTAARENSAVFTSLPDACTQSTGGAYGPDPITKMTYDLAGQELTETRGYGTPLVQAYTTFTWGLDGEKTSVTDANSNTIQLGYDGFNRLNKITHPDTTTETSVYDPDGDLVIWTNRGGFGVVRCYDALNRKVSDTGITGATLSGACATGGTTNLTTRSWDIQPRTFTYDLAGRLTEADIPGFPISYTYDAAGRPLNRGGSWYAGYGWDGAGNLSALTYPDSPSTVVNYQYDALNRTTAACENTVPGCASPTLGLGSLSYDSLGRRQTLTLYDGSTQTWNYDNADRVTSMVHVFQNRTTDNVTFTYGYDPSGRDTSRTLDNSAYAYVPAAASTTYAAANALNQYPSVGGYAFSYWPEGGLKQTDTFQANYNELGKASLTYITTTPGTVDPNHWDIQGLDALNHVYFHEAQTAAGQPYPWIYHANDGLRPETILEWQWQALNGSTQTLQGVRRYVLGPDPDERWAFLDMNGTIQGVHTDREGTTIALANGGKAVLQFNYDAYGQSPVPGTDVGPGGRSFLYRYTGQRLDPNTGLYDYKAREYSSGFGRFLQPDPAGLDQGPNLYEYVSDEPLDLGDPTGTLACANPGPCQVYAGAGSGSSSAKSAKKPNGTSAFDDWLDALSERVRLIISNNTDYDGGGWSGYFQHAWDEGWAVLQYAPGEGAAFKGLALLGRGAQSSTKLLRSSTTCCFAAGTLVDTDHGLQPIEQIRVGDRVLSRDEITGVTEYKPVLSLIHPHHRQIFSLTLEIGEHGTRHRSVFNVTDDHPWRTPAGRWVQTIALTPRDQIVRAHGSPARVISVRRTARVESTYNLEVADFHTYFVGRDRLWVHNANCFELHHLLPRQFQSFFSKAGLDIEEHTVELSADAHRLTPNGVHAGPQGASWNGVWRGFIERFPNANKSQILQQLEKMRKQFGI